MIRALSTTIQFTSNNIRRRRHQFVPSNPGNASFLEDRRLLSAMGGMTRHALVAAPHSTPPNSSVGPIIANSDSSGSSTPSAHSTPPNSSVGPIIA